MTIDHTNLRALALASTQGKLVAMVNTIDGKLHHCVGIVGTTVCFASTGPVDNWESQQSAADAAYIAAANPAAVLALLDERSALLAALEIIANPAASPSHGDPTTLRDFARSAIAANATAKGGNDGH